jgi:thiamine-phosphate pyrophosphorylase
MPDQAEPTRLVLVTPPNIDATTFAPRLEEALSAGDVAAVLIYGLPEDVTKHAQALVPVIQSAGAAALIAEDTRLAGRVGADGVHIEGAMDDVRLALESFRGKRIVGAGRIDTRHRAMEAGEAGVDYLFFGRPHGDTHDAPHPKALALAEWWAEVAEVPAVMMAGRSPESARAAAATGAAFVALNAAIWESAEGAGNAVRVANAALSAEGRRAA